MPIKLPKGFQRRKSSGNALDEIHNPPEPSSFRVFERPGSRDKSFDGGALLRSVGDMPPRPPPKNSFDNEEEGLFSVKRPDAGNRGSGGTENSLSTAQYSSAASSTRLSTSSTNPSSNDARSDENIRLQGQRPFNDIPVPPPPSARPGFLRNQGRNSGRAFSFGVGNKGHKESPTSSPNLPTPGSNNRMSLNGRDRAMTASSASTATPPKLFDSDLALDSSELDGFENMFDNIGLQRSRDASPNRHIQTERTIPSSAANYPPNSYPGVEFSRSNRAPAPKPISTGRGAIVESSPYSWTSQDSRDGLMRSPSPSKTVVQASPPTKISGPRQLPSPKAPNAKFGVFGRKPLSRDTATANASRNDNHSLDSVPTRVGESPAAALSPRGVQVEADSSISQEEGAGLDPTLIANAELAVRYQEVTPSASKPLPTKKVMTPAQFERYKEQQERDRRMGYTDGDSDSDNGGDNYEEDDHAEREKDAAKQRRKQEAHLAVYRQTMMKVTGEQTGNRSASSLGTPMGLFRNQSSPELDNRLSQLTMDTRQSGKSSGDDEEEDEDVPLGILAAHGFPNRNRPPTRLTNSLSNSNLRGIGQQQQAAPSVAAESMKRGSLPVFARNLPQDPYYGAGLVNQSNRESLAIHGSPTMPSMSSGASTMHPTHPSGLVGVIAGEERARALRRGSPNTQGNYDVPPGGLHPGMVRSQTTGNLPQMMYPGMMPGMPPPMTPGDQAQIQMSHQMNQMMQMQMQWMQQMQQMMGGQLNPGQVPPQLLGQNMPGSNFLAPPNQMQRPQSMQVQSTPGPGQRTMSTLNPSMAPWNSTPSLVGHMNGNGNYAPSIAPSERSNVGLAARYRPVSIIADLETQSTKRASTFTSSTFRPWSSLDTLTKPSIHLPKPSVSQATRRSPQIPEDDDDDEQGWAEMKVKKDKKQKSWKLRKGQNALQELYNGVPQ